MRKIYDAIGVAAFILLPIGGIFGIFITTFYHRYPFWKVAGIGFACLAVTCLTVEDKERSIFTRIMGFIAYGTVAFWSLFGNFPAMGFAEYP